jgi:hypothetical protein
MTIKEKAADKWFDLATGICGVQCAQHQNDMLDNCILLIFLLLWSAAHDTMANLRCSPLQRRRAA